jgi:hypothetical protein
MIDFEHFWAEPGCFPGLSRAETEAQLKQLAAQFGQHGMPAPDLDLEPGMRPGPPVTAQEVTKWEKGHGVRLPDVLRQAFARQDGGFVADSHVRIFPLEEIVDPTEDFWEYTSYETEDIPDRGLIFQFAEEGESGGALFLNYNVNGPQGDPGVLEHHSDPGDLDPVSKSVTQFLTGMLELFDSPSVEWAETAALEVIARERIDLSPLYGPGAEKEQVLGRQGGALVLFTHEQLAAGESYTKAILPALLFRDAAMIMNLRPAPVDTYGLMLQPKDSGGVVHTQSRQTSGNRWKNQSSHGSPVCVQFESQQRGRLEELRRTLIGEQAANRAQAREEKQEKLQKKIQALTPEQRQTTMLQAMLQSMPPIEPGDPTLPGLFEGMPAEAAALQDALQQRLREIQRRAEETIAKHPADPEMLRLMKEMITGPRPHEGDE